MWIFGLAYGAAVQQRTVHQETMIAKHGTLPAFMCQRHCIYSDDPVHVVFEEAIRDVLEAGRPGDDSQTVQAMDDESSEYDESSNEDNVEISDESGNVLLGEIGSSATFLLRARSRFGRAIRFNNRLLS